MNELEQVWPQILEQAIAEARAGGRHDVADYLALKASNDQIRVAGVKWLFDSTIEAAAEANRGVRGIAMEREEPHNFLAGSSNMVGSRLILRYGVRLLSIEAGWTRTPKDGIMRRSSLAYAKITHFGMPKQNQELFLLRRDEIPNWFAARADDSLQAFDSQELLRHFRLFIGE